jgi:Beta-propeller repeat
MLVSLFIATIIAPGSTKVEAKMSSAKSRVLKLSSSSNLWYLTRGEAWTDKGWGVDVDALGNIYLAGLEQHYGELYTDIGVYKFSPDGTQLWYTPWGRPYTDKAFVVTVAEPYVYVGGLTQTGVGFNTADMLILKLDASSGAVVDEFTWGQGFGYEEVDGLVVQGNDIYAAGWTTSPTSQDMAVLKLTTELTPVYTTTWGSPGYDEANGQIVVDADHIYVAGYYNGHNSALVAFDKNTLAYQWHALWDTPNAADALGLTSDGTNLYLVGLTLIGTNGQIFILKYGADHQFIWSHLWGGAGGESARAIAIDASGNILVAGKTDSYGVGANDVAFLQFDQEGKLNWQRTWGGSAIDEAHGLTLNGELAYIAGETFSFGAGQADMLLLKANAETGQMPWWGTALIFMPLVNK